MGRALGAIPKMALRYAACGRGLNGPVRSGRILACSIVDGVARKAAARGESVGVDDKGFLR